MFLEISQNSQARISFLIKLQAPACNFIKNETLAQVFSYAFCEISKNTFFTEHLRKTASVPLKTTNEPSESDSQESDSRIFLNYSEYFIFDYVIR